MSKEIDPTKPPKGKWNPNIPNILKISKTINDIMNQKQCPKCKNTMASSPVIKHFCVKCGFRDKWDQGHQNLLDDCYNLFNEAEKFEFHDFKCEKYETPKLDLYRKLMKMADAVKNGKYDN